MFFISHKAFIFLLTVSCYSSLVLPIDKKNITYTRIYYNSNKNATTKLPSSKVSSKDFEKNLSSLGNKPAPPTKRTTDYTLPVTLKREEKFTKKQYEIINMLWRKTKIYLEVTASTSAPKQNHDNLTKTIFDFNEESNPFIFSPGSQILQSTTPSYIEFYYSDEINDQATAKDCVNRKCQPKGDKYNANLLTHNSSFVVFRIKPMPKTAGNQTKARIINLNCSGKSTISLKFEKKSTNTLKGNETATHETMALRCMTETVIQPTTEYDKIKFFELYDQLTPTPVSLNKNKVNIDEASQAKIYRNDTAILELVKKNLTHKKPRHSRKHITDNYMNQGVSCFNKNNAYKEPKFIKMEVIPEEQNKTSYTTVKSHVKLTTKEKQRAKSYTNRSVSWSEYPYAAVYVYEPLQVS